MTKRIIVLGGGMVGLFTSLLLTRQGHEVTLIEADDATRPDAPEAAFDSWHRRGVAQFRQPHFLHSGGRVLLDQHLPEITPALLEAGCVRFDVLGLMPPSVTDRTARPGDERFVTVTGRRATLESAIAKLAEDRVHVFRGLSVVGLVIGSAAADGVPRVIGVRTADGFEFHADLVVDATGRRSKLPEWLEAAGARRPFEQAEESGFFYYTRFFRDSGNGLPNFRAGLLTDFHSYSLLTLPSDSNTWSVTVFCFVGDPIMKALRDVDRWTALLRAHPTHAQWLAGEPISDVIPMGGITDRYRRFVVDGSPVATGVLAVGDAWGCTNPVGGRGMTMGLMHALGTADVVKEHVDDPLALGRAHDAMTESRLKPWYDSTVQVDRMRMAQINRAIQGLPPQPPTGVGEALLVAMPHDARLFRAYLEIVSLLALPADVFARPGMVDRTMAVADVHGPMALPGPSRSELVRMLS